MDRLLKRARLGDDKAFIKLFEQYELALWKTAMAVLNNTSDADDAIQETMIKAWKALPGFEERSSLGTWITRILLRTCYDTLRSRKAERSAAGSPLIEGLAVGEEIDEADLNQVPALIEKESFINRDEAIDIERTMDRLTQDDRLLLTLYYLNDQSTKEIASILRITEDAVRKRLSRARVRFNTVYTAKAYNTKYTKKEEVLSCVKTR